MRIVFTSFGSTGDIQPFLALATEFRKHGHHPVLALPPNFHARVRGLELEFVPLGPELDAALIRSVGERLTNVGDPAEQVRHFLNALAPAIPRMYRELLDICAEADCLVSSPFQIVARMIYEKLGIPFVSVHMSQFGALGTKAVQSVSASIVNRCRAEFGHPPLKDPLGQEGTSPDLALYAVSNRVLRRPAAWPAHHHVVGFFFLEENGFVPDEALQAFMEGPDKPIVVSFGSMIHEAPEKVTDILVKVVDKLGRRTVIQRGWSDLGSAAVAGRIRIVDFVPHDWLFSRASCVVHHGGAGTTAATFKAGVPAVVVPHTLDQPIWGQIARAFGCAPVVIPFMQLTVDGLVKGLEEALNNPKYANSAASLSRDLALQNGVCTARQLVERLVSEKSWRRAGETAKRQRTGGA